MANELQLALMATFNVTHLVAVVVYFLAILAMGFVIFVLIVLLRRARGRSSEYEKNKSSRLDKIESENCSVRVADTRIDSKRNEVSETDWVGEERETEMTCRRQ